MAVSLPLSFVFRGCIYIILKPDKEEMIRIMRLSYFPKIMLLRKILVI